MASNTELSVLQTSYEKYNKNKTPGKNKPKTPDKTPTQANSKPLPPPAHPPLSTYNPNNPPSPTPSSLGKREHGSTPNSTKAAKQAHIYRSPTPLEPINLPTGPISLDQIMQDPIDESALFGQSQVSIDWSAGDAQFARTNKINDLLTQLLSEFNGAKESNYLNQIFEDEDVAESLQNLAAFLPSYVSPNELNPISSGIAEIKKLVEQVLSRSDTANVPNPADTSINGSVHAPQFSQVTSLPPMKPPTANTPRATPPKAPSTTPYPTKTPTNPNASHHPSRLVVHFLPNGLHEGLRPDPSAIVGGINSSLDKNPACKHLRVVAASFNPQGNLILSTRSDQLAADLLNFQNKISPTITHISNNQQFILREDKKWFKLQIDGVNTSSVSIGNNTILNSADSIHMELTACNPIYANLHNSLVSKPRWLRTDEELRTTSRSSLVFALTDESLARQILKQRFLAAHGRHCSVRAFQDRPPVTQCRNCWRLDHSTHRCKEEKRCRICSGLHDEKDHPFSNPNDCPKCRLFAEMGDSMDTSNEGQCPHDMRCLNCLGNKDKEHNHPADARRCLSRLEKYGTARENER